MKCIRLHVIRNVSNKRRLEASIVICRDFIRNVVVSVIDVVVPLVWAAYKRAVENHWVRTGISSAIVAVLWNRWTRAWSMMRPFWRIVSETDDEGTPAVSEHVVYLSLSKCQIGRAVWESRHLVRMHDQKCGIRGVSVRAPLGKPDKPLWRFRSLVFDVVRELIEIVHELAVGGQLREEESSSGGLNSLSVFYKVSFYLVVPRAEL